eukprot:m51a1_g11054 hypothetical protein (344) ;mRNA; r:513018-514191
MPARLLSSLDTVEPADLVEFCPDADRERPVFLCTTYLLHAPSDSAPQRKTGGICLAGLDRESGAMTVLHRAETSAVFDARWFGPRLLYAACADGTLLRSTLLDSRAALAPTAVAADCSGDAVTYVCQRRPVDASSAAAVTCHDSGAAAVWRAREGSDELACEATWPAHDFQAWVCESAPDGSALYTGGDDAKLRGWDVRDGSAAPLFTKRFGAGVTALQVHPDRPLLAVGSYDQSLSLWDMRAMARPLGAFEGVGGGGGVWRLKWSRAGGGGDALLGACMQGGFRVWGVSDAQDVRQAAEFYKPHESIAYGADWLPDDAKPGSFTAVVCSFYDHLLSSWEINI